MNYKHNTLYRNQIKKGGFLEWNWKILGTKSKQYFACPEWVGFQIQHTFTIKILYLR